MYDTDVEYIKASHVAVLNKGQVDAYQDEIEHLKAGNKKPKPRPSLPAFQRRTMMESTCACTHGDWNDLEKTIVGTKLRPGYVDIILNIKCPSCKQQKHESISLSFAEILGKI